MLRGFTIYHLGCLNLLIGQDRRSIGAITMSTSQSLSAQCEDILASIKEFEKTDQTDRAQRLRLVQSLNKLTHRLKEPKEAIFDHFTNVRQLPLFRSPILFEM